MMHDEFVIEPLNSLIDRTVLNFFSCGNEKEEEQINKFLREEASESDLLGYTKTFVFFNKMMEPIGFFSLCTGATKACKSFKQNKLKIFNNPNRTQVSVFSSVDIVYFAISKKHQRQSLGSLMMRYLFDFLYSKIYINIGFTLVTVQSRQSTVEFYKKVGFESHAIKSGKDNQLAVPIYQIEELLYGDLY